MPGKFDVTGRFDLDRAAPSRKPGTDLVRAPAQEILPPTATPERWHPRPTQQLEIPMPGVVRGFWGGVNLPKTREGIEEHTRCVRAVTDNTKAKTELEEAITTHERTLAKREHMPALIEQDREEVIQRTLETQAKTRRLRFEHEEQEKQDRQDARNRERVRELEALEYEKARALKERELAEARVELEHAEAIAERKAALRALKADVDVARFRADVQAERGRAQSADEEEGMPRELREALKTETRFSDIDAAAAALEQQTLAKVGGDETQLSEDDRDTLERIRQGRVRAREAVEAEDALGVIFPRAAE
jgi:hypothetical protein